MTGTTEDPPEAPVPLARSWLEPPALTLAGEALVNEAYDRARCTFVSAPLGMTGTESGGQP
jgi:hypothetical protein